ncbi:hypothetical protein BC834DRAFT_799006, partial [Gloeopeniophorella convolvens]
SPLAQKVCKWFDNRSRKALARFMHFTCKWSARNVFYQENRDKIMNLTEQNSGAPPGTPVYFGYLQRTTTELMAPVIEDEMAVLQETANEWSLRGPPCEIQCRLALKMRGRVIRDFQEQLYRYCGIRTFVL